METAREENVRCELEISALEFADAFAVWQKTANQGRNQDAALEGTMQARKRLFAAAVMYAVVKA